MKSRSTYYLDFSEQAELILDAASIHGVDLEQDDIFDLLDALLTEVLNFHTSDIVDDVVYIILLEHGLEKFYTVFKKVMLAEIYDTASYIEEDGIDLSDFISIVWGEGNDCLITYNT